MDHRARTERVEEISDLKTSTDDLEVSREEKIVEPLSADDHIRLHDASARRRREAWLTGAGLAILLVVALGCFVVFVFTDSAEKIRITSQIITMVVTALVGFLFSHFRPRE